MTRIENHLVCLDKDFQALTVLVENLIVDLLDELRIFEVEKNKARQELSSRKNFVINEEHDDSSVWGTSALLTSCES